MLRKILVAAAAVGLMGVSSASAELIYGLAGLTLVRFDSATPGTVTTVGSFTGVPAGQSVRGIDFRPADGKLYALTTGSSSPNYSLFTVNTSTAAFTLVGSGAAGANLPIDVSIDFNPVADRLRVVAGTTRQNFRVNPTSGALVLNDTATTAGRRLSDVAYSNNVAGATSTTMYAYDFLNDELVTVGSVGGTPNSPNGGLVATVGLSGVFSASSDSGFDISGDTGVAYLQWNATDANYVAAGVRTLGTVNLATGAVTSLGTIGANVYDIAVPVTIPEPSALSLLAVPAVAVLRRRRA